MPRLPVALCLMWIVTSCSPREPMSRPAESGAPTPRPDAGPPAVVSSEPPPAPAEPKDPLAPANPPDCGPERPNPHGVAHEWRARRDGSCLVCEQAPASLPACKPGDRGLVITPATLEANRGKSTKLEGAVRLPHAYCTKRGGLCACNNRCWAMLHLAAEGAETPYVVLTSKDEPLACSGDDGSLCCPFALDATSRSAHVIVTGALTRQRVDGVEDADAPLQLEVTALCRVG